MQKYAVELSEAPETFPVSLEEAKIHLRLGDLDEEDDLIEVLIAAATEQAEIFTGRRLITQEWTYYQDSFASDTCDGSILLPYPPISEVTTVKYYDSAGTLTTLVKDTDYSVDIVSMAARIRPAPQRVWPVTQLDKMNAVVIDFTSGYGEGANVPGSIKAAILLILAHFYEHRQEFIVGSIVTPIPKNSEWLLWPYRYIRNL